MVKHPRYQAMDQARQDEIPLAFEKFCKNKEKYEIRIIEPKIPEESIPGPTPRPTFQIIDKTTGELLAYLHPYGHGECCIDEFEDTYNKIFKQVEKAAVRALKEYNKMRKKEKN